MAMPGGVNPQRAELLRHQWCCLSLTDSVVPDICTCIGTGALLAAASALAAHIEMLAAVQSPC